MTNVETGERVEVRPLDANRRRRGLTFEPGTEGHCGETRRGLAPSERIADACVARQGLACSGLYDWREARLQRRAGREREAA
ncbi:MAG: hypothetical protein ACLPN5_03595 [Roseiarcus sp.]